MPRFTVRTTVVYEFEVEAEEYIQAILEGHKFDDYYWNSEIEDITATVIEEDEEEK
jgi:hypothetical protein